MQAKIKALLSSKLDVHSKNIAKKSFLSIIVKGIGIIATLGISIILGRILGVEGYGTIEFANRFVSLIMIVCLFGMQNVVLKEVSIGYYAKDWQRVKDSLWTSLLLTGVLAISSAVILLLLSPFLSLSIFKNELLIIPLQIGIVSAIFQTISRSFASAVNGFNKVWQSNLVDQTLSMIVVLIGIGIFKISHWPINLITISFLYGFSRIVVTITISSFWKRIFTFKSTKFSFKNEMLKPASHLWIGSAAGLIALNLNSVMLGAMSSFTDVGLFNASSRIVSIIIVILGIVNSAVAPTFASFYSQKKLQDLQMVFNRLTLGLIFLSGFIIVSFLIGGKMVLGLLGNEFVEAYPILVVHTIGHGSNMAIGGVAILLMMAGKEKVVGRLSILNLIIGTSLSGIFIYFFGAVGAAVGSAISIILINILRCRFVRKEIGINANPFTLLYSFVRKRQF